jgi:signal peptidase II
MAKKAMAWLLMLLTIALVGCDHATKLAAETVLERRGPLELVPGLLDLRYAQNHDTAFSLLASVGSPAKGAAILVVSALAMVAVAALWWRRRGAPRREQAAYALILAGAAGNVLDRILRGYVVDFIHLHHWPVFNVADVAIVIGVLLLAATSLGRRPKPGGAAAGG